MDTAMPYNLLAWAAASLIVAFGFWSMVMP